MMADLIDRRTLRLMKTEECAGHSIEYAMGWKACIEWIKTLPSAQLEPQWIPVSKRLPEDERKCYWVCTDTGYQCECRWTNINHIWTELTTDWHWHIMDIPQYSHVVAWRELPEPYKEEQDG